MVLATLETIFAGFFLTKLNTLTVLLSPSSLCSPYSRPMNRRRGAEARNTTLFGKPADREDGRLVSLKNHLMGVWMPVSLTESERERR